MGGKNSAPAPPDYSGIAAAAKQSSDQSFQLGEDQLAWAKDQYASDSAITKQVVDAAIQTQNTNDATAAADRQRYQQTYQPLEDQLVQDANNYNSPAQKQNQMGEAVSQVNTQFDAQRNAAMQNLEGFGVDPSATRYAALDIGTRASQGAAQAAAANTASNNVDATGRALRSEAINVGRGYPGQIAGQYGTALQAGNQAVNSQLATTASGANTMGTATQWNALGNNALGVWGNTLSQGYNAQMQQYNANQQSSSGIGSLLGTIAGVGASVAGFEAGGPVLPVPANATPGGAVNTAASPSRGAVPDDVNAKLTAGEFVMPKDAVAWLGEKKMRDIIQKTREERAIPTGIGGKPAPANTNTPVAYVSRPGMAIPAQRAA